MAEGDVVVSPGGMGEFVLNGGVIVGVAEISGVIAGAPAGLGVGVITG
jgi:hypothetical protein